MMKKLSILLLLSHAAGTYAMQDAPGAGDANSTTQAGSSNGGVQEEVVLDVAQLEELKALAQQAGAYASMQEDDRVAFWNRLNLLPQAPGVIRLKDEVQSMQEEIETREGVRQEQEAQEKAQREEAARKEQAAQEEAKREKEEKARKIKEGIEANRLAREQEAQEKAQRDEAARKEQEAQEAQVQELMELQRKILFLEGEHGRCAANPNYKSPFPGTDYQEISNGLSSLGKDGVTQQIRNDAKTLSDRLVAFTKMPYGKHILGIEPKRPVVVLPQGTSGTSSSANKGGQGGNLSTNKGGKPDKGNTSSSGDDKKKGRAWIRPAVGITLVALAGYGLWNWYSNNTKTKTK